MKLKKGDLSVPVLLMMGGALYSMHFGASSMVWPMTWGKGGYEEKSVNKILL